MIKVFADALVPIFAGLLFGYIAGLRRIMAFGSSPQLASSGLIASYIASVATLPAWIVIVNHLG